MSRFFLSLLFVLLLTLAACTSAAQPIPTPTSPPPATSTPLPTETPMPSPTPTLAEFRRPAENGLDMEAQFRTEPITLDGQLDDWPGFPCYRLDQKEQIAYGDVAAWGGPQDLSASFCWRWDQEALYLGIEVVDDLLRIFSKGNFWENDYVELWIDADLAGDFDKAQNDGDDFQFGFLPGNFADIAPRATVFVPGVSTSKLRQIQVASSRTESGYRMEVKIPFVVFGDALKIGDGRLGAALAVSDCDADAPAQEMMISAAPKSISQWGNPTLWTNLILVGYGSTPAPVPVPTPTPTATSGAGSIAPTATAIKAPIISITFNHYTPADHQFVYLDVDNNPQTGSRSLYPGLGVDFLIQDDSLYYWTNLVNPYTWAPNAWNWMSVVRVKNTATQSVWTFSSLAIRRPDISSGRPIKVAFSRQDASWAGLYFSQVINMTEFTLVHTEPPPAPTPTPAPLYTFSFQNNFVSGDHLFLYIDSDNNPSTGFSIGGIGADYMVQDAWMFKWAGSWSSHPCTLFRTLSANAAWQFPSTCLNNPPFGFKVVFERQNSSWAAVYTSPALTVSGYNLHHAEQPPFLLSFQNNFATGDHLFVYFDTDNNPATGFSVGGIGADYMIQDSWMFKWTGSWSGQTCSMSASLGSNASWRFPAACLGHPALGFKAIFQRQNSNWAAVYTSPALTMSGYSLSHTEPAPPPTFAFTFNNNYSAGSRLRLYLNTDNNLTTGDWIGGADYMVEWHPDGSSAGMYQWTGTTWTWFYCPSLSAAGTSTTTWSFQATCIGSPSFPFTANFVRLDSNYNIQHNGGPVTVSGYTLSYSEPAPPATFSFTFDSQYSSGDILMLYLNTDNNTSTGNWIGGAEYRIQWDGSWGAIYQWNASTGNWDNATCSSLNHSGLDPVTWTFDATCIGSPSFPFTVNFLRFSSGWSLVYNSGPISVSGYSLSHAE